VSSAVEEWTACTCDKTNVLHYTITKCSLSTFLLVYIQVSVVSSETGLDK